jgi:hypothetical protein
VTKDGAIHYRGIYELDTLKNPKIGLNSPSESRELPGKNPQVQSDQQVYKNSTNCIGRVNSTV